MFRLLFALLGNIDESVERWLAGDEGWRNTALLAIVSQTLTLLIFFSFISVIGGAVYICWYVNPDMRWLPVLVLRP